MICGICGRNRPESMCVVVTLTAKERVLIATMTQSQAPTEYVYCRPCHKLTSDKRQGAQFISGMVRSTLRAEGDPKAEEVGRKMLEFLLERSSKLVS